MLIRSSSNAPKDTGTCIPEERSLSPEEVADYEELRTLFSPTVGLKLLDDFAKWLFALSGTAGVLGAGFGVSGANDLSPAGGKVFAAAVACIAVSLALASLSRLPLPSRVNRYSPDSMKRALRRLLWTRFGLLATAALFFAAGLVLAGYAQIA